MRDDVSVAIVDDETNIAMSYEILFRRRNIPLAFVARDGFEAMDRFRNAVPKPGIIIIDYRLPYMSGLDLMREILKIEPQTRVVFISGEDDVRQDVLDAGASAFLKKPVGVRKIYEAVSSLLNADRIPE